MNISLLLIGMFGTAIGLVLSIHNVIGTDQPSCTTGLVALGFIAVGLGSAYKLLS